MPLSAWDRTRIHGTWYTHAGVRVPGTYTVTMPARVTVETGEAIVPAGVYKTGDLHTGDESRPALDVMVPANDDPDVTPLGWQLVIVVNLAPPGQSRIIERYVVDTPAGGEVNLRTIVLAQAIPASQSMLLRGVAGGVAALDREGRVVDADGVPVGDVDPALVGEAVASYLDAHPPAGGGTTTWVSIDKPPVIAAGATAAAARQAIGAGTSDLALGSTSSTAAAGDHSHAWDAITDRPATFPPAGHPHSYADIRGLTWDTLTDRPAVVAAGATAAEARSAIGAGTSNLALGSTSATAKRGDWTPTVADVTGLQTALDGKQPAGSYVTGTDPRLSDARPPTEHVHDSRYVRTVNGTGPDGAGNVTVQGGGTGVTDHGALTGLGDDDHPQYLTQGRGDARYVQPSGLPAAPTWTTLTGRPAVVAAGATAAEARTAIGAGTSSLALGTTSSTAAAGNHAHAWSAITGKPATFPPAAHTHAVGDVTGLQAALDGKAAAGHTHTAADVGAVSASGGVTAIWAGTQAQYDALPTKPATTLHVITGTA